MIYGPSKRLTQNPNPRQYPPIAPTAAPSGWLTEEELVRVATSIAACRQGGTVWLLARDADALFAMARAALHHQAALETATDLPLGEVIAAWRAVKKCTDEFLPEYPGACEEYKSVLHEQLNALEVQR